jgi:predicted RNase H-like HicB family nuclease
MAKPVQIVYVNEDDGGWSARSPQVRGWTAYARSFAEVQRRAHEGIPFFLGGPVLIYDPTLKTDNRASSLWAHAHHSPA